MRRVDWKRKGRGEGPSPLPRLLLLSLFFLAGVILGQVLAGRISEELAQELVEYLRLYVALEGECSPWTVLSALVLYFRYPLLAVLLGFASLGVALLPCITVAFGFFLSFSVCCFTAAFGEGGVVLALAILGLRCVVTLAGASLGRRSAPVYGKDWWLRLAVCVGVLLAGMCVDLYLSPWLLQLALEHGLG